MSFEDHNADRVIDLLVEVAMSTKTKTRLYITPKGFAIRPEDTRPVGGAKLILTCEPKGDLT